MGDMINLLSLALLIGSGVYAVYSVIKLNRLHYLFPNRFLYPANCSPDDCTDVPGFIAYITPRLLIFGIACLLLGAFLGVVWFTSLIPLPYWANMIALPLLGVLVFVGYMFIQNRVAKRFW